MMPQVDAQMIHKQVAFLDQLRKTNYEHVLPFSPICDLNNILKKVRRKRQEKQKEINWEKHKKTQSSKNSQQTCEKRNDNSLFEPNNILFNTKHVSGSKREFICENSFTERSENVFLEIMSRKEVPSLKLKYETEEEPNIIPCIYSGKELKPLDFNTLLLKVKRERKKKKFEEKWRHFAQKKMEHQIFHCELNQKLSNELNSYKRSDVYSELIGERDLDEEKKESEIDDSFCECPSHKCNDINSEYCNRDSAGSHDMISPDITNDNVVDRENEVLEECGIMPDENFSEGRKHEQVEKEPNSQGFAICNEEIMKVNQTELKITAILTDIKTLLSKNHSINLPDEDGERMKKRSNQFAMLFKRNYSYRIAQQLNELRSLSLNIANGSQSTIIFIKKISFSFNSALQALQALQKQLKMGITVVSTKDIFIEFFQHAFKLLQLKNVCFENTDNNVENQIVEIMDELKGIKNLEAIPKQVKNLGKKEIKQGQVSLWLKKSTALARTKFGPPTQLRKQKSSHSIQPKPKEEGSTKQVVYSLNENKTKSICSDITEGLGTESEIIMTPNGIPEESLSATIAKRIQEVPGVDEELRKVEDTRIKLMSVLLNIKNAMLKNLNNSISPGEEYERIKHRTLEFIARFKRNYFYRMKCQVHELRSMDPNPLKIKQKSKILLVTQKLTAAHQSGLQAFQVVEKQLQTISILGLTHDLLSSYYSFIYELTFMLKPFYGYMKTQVLDDVEKLILETVKVFQDSIQPEIKTCNKSIINKKPISQKNKQLNPKQKRPKNKPLSRKVYAAPKNISSKEITPKSVPLRQIQPEVHKTLELEQEPRTMVEILAEHDSDDSCTRQSSHHSSKAISSESIKNLVLKEIKTPAKSTPLQGTPRNIQFISVLRPESGPEEAIPESKIMTSSVHCCPIMEGVFDRKKEIKDSKTTNMFYKKSIQSVKSMAEKLMDELLHESIETIIKQIQMPDFFTSLKSIIEDE